VHVAGPDSPHRPGPAAWKPGIDLSRLTSVWVISRE
jgi:hypothetical protein